MPTVLHACDLRPVAGRQRAGYEHREDFDQGRICHDIDEWELYDLLSGPDELKNIYDDPSCADVVMELTIDLTRLRARYNDTTGAPV